MTCIVLSIGQRSAFWHPLSLARMEVQEALERYSSCDDAKLLATATNFSVRRCLIVNKYTDIKWEVGPWRVVGTKNAEGRVCVEMNKG